TGWFGLAVLTDSDLDQAPLIQSAGYPARTKPYGTQWYDAGRAGRYSDGFISYWVDTEEGQSGAPIFFSNAAGQRWVVATHVYSQSHSNLGQRVTEDVFKTISDWLA
ncbi:MAG: serine protease, partial [Alphaproteobacteria bacterium]